MQNQTLHAKFLYDYLDDFEGRYQNFERVKYVNDERVFKGSDRLTKLTTPETAVGFS